MQVFKDQAGWTHIFGPNHHPPGLLHGPQIRKPIHGSQSTKWIEIRSNLKKLVKEYCSNSSIHGMSYIGSRKSLLERLWWIAVFVLSLYGCGRLIDNVYQKWSNNPVIVTFDDNPIPVWVLPFPAVTICPQVKFRSKYMNFTEDFYQFANFDGTWKALEQERLDRLLAVLQVCDKFFQTYPKYLEMYARNLSYANMVEILRNISIEAEQTILTCHINGVKCKELFTESLTDEGICFTFNGFSSYDLFRDGLLHDEYRYLNGRKNITNWSTESGFVSGKTDQSYPIRALGSGIEAGLSMLLMVADTDVEEHCREQQGFKIILHAPREYPQVRKKFVLVSYSQDVTLAVRPLIYKTSTDLSGYHPNRRHCYFSHERPLKYFRTYTQSNCELECVANFTLQLCGCVKFSMPRSKGTRVCQTSEIGCVIKAENELLKRAATNRLKKEQKYDTACDCIQGCTSIQYDSEITQTKCDFKKTLVLRLGPEKPSIGKAIAMRQISKLTIYFKNTQFITSKRSELFGTTDFIANCGGILGLCLGVSLFSLVELLYYCMVRPVLVVRDSLQNERKVTIVKEKYVGRY